MGLDMYLYAEKYVSGWNGQDQPNRDQLVNMFSISDSIVEQSGVTIRFNVAYWRKANAIHHWFVDNVQDGQDECQSHYVSREHLLQLKAECELVIFHLENTDSSAPDDLPLAPQSGFFFGSTQRDQWYLQDLRYTRDRISHLFEVLSSDWDFKYRSSW
jgi:hypothetical protein